MLCHVCDLKGILQKYKDVCAYDEGSTGGVVYHHGGVKGMMTAIDGRHEDGGEHRFVDGCTEDRGTCAGSLLGNVSGCCIGNIGEMRLAA